VGTNINYYKFLRVLLLAFAALTAGWSYSPSLNQPSALVLEVNSITDAIDVSPGDGLCETAPGNGLCTLRAAIMEANAHPGPDTITFGTICPACYKDTFSLSIPGSSDDAAATGDLDITDNLTLIGKAARRTIIDGGGAAINDRVFHVDPAGAGITVTISDVTIQNGNVSGEGGGILNDGAAVLKLTNVTVNSNSASHGGGVYNYSNLATITLTNVTISGNQAAQDIGGMGNHGVATLTNVTVSGNTASGSTGGLFLGGVATLTNVTVSSNVASGANGGLSPGGLELGGNTTLINTTISGNTGDPGGIWNGGRTSLTNVTLSDNTGGIINCDNCGAKITLQNTIIANSYFISNLNCYGAITSTGHNLDSGNGCGFAGPGDIVNANPLLGPLAYTVGRTKTQPLLSGSPAIDAGDKAGCPATDQRGVSRSQGVACDIGAYELQVVAFVVNDLNDVVDMNPGDGTCATTTGVCTLRAAIQEANAHPGPDAITFSVNGIFALSISGPPEDAAARGDLDIAEDLTITGNGDLATIIDGGGMAVKERVFHVHRAGAGITVSISGVKIQNGNAFPSNEGGGILNGDSLDVEPARLILANSIVISNSVDGIAFNVGGGIANNGDLELSSVRMKDNKANGGGAIYNGNAATAILTHVTLSYNKARNLEGGGIFNGADATTILNSSTVTGNTADNWNGGGIANFGTITLINSTIYNNRSKTDGGGIWNNGNLSLTNVTISSNYAGGLRGGGIWNGKAATLTNVTVTFNQAGQFGGGIRNSVLGTITLKNTIVANSPFGGNCAGTITSNGHNLDSDNTCSFAGTGDLSNTNPLLGPLTNNGGRTQTYALLSGSPAIDAGDNVGCPSPDQRDTTRPQDDDGNGVAVCDIGSVEGIR
jgi:CSLREA domain-containing protein